LRAFFPQTAIPITRNTAIIGRAGNEEPVFGEVVEVDAPPFAELLPPPLTLTVTVCVFLLLLSFLLVLLFLLLLSFLLPLSLVLLAVADWVEEVFLFLVSPEVVSFLSVLFFVVSLSVSFFEAESVTPGAVLSDAGFPFVTVELFESVSVVVVVLLEFVVFVVVVLLESVVVVVDELLESVVVVVDVLLEPLLFVVVVLLESVLLTVVVLLESVLLYVLFVVFVV
jgi:hypothetical protein